MLYVPTVQDILRVKCPPCTPRNGKRGEEVCATLQHLGFHSDHGCMGSSAGVLVRMKRRHVDGPILTTTQLIARPSRLRVLLCCVVLSKRGQDV